MAETKTALQRIGLSRGKAILIGVLGVVLVVVLYVQFGKSSGEFASEPVASAPRRRAAVGQVTPPDGPAKAEKKLTAEKDSSVELVGVVDEARWKSPNLADVVDYDPFALPAVFPKPQAIEAAAVNREKLVAAAAADDAKRLADAIAQLQRQLEELKQRGVQVIVRERDQYVAMIGDRTVHVGDEINGFTVIGIDQSGVSVERKSAQ